MDDWGNDGIFYVRHSVQTGSRAHSASYPTDIGSSFTGGERAWGREAEHSPPTSAEVKNAWSHISTPTMRLRVVVLN
jgi:hypothetical protein